MATGDGEIAVQFDGVGVECEPQIGGQPGPGVGAIHHQYVLAPELEQAHRLIGAEHAAAIQPQGARSGRRLRSPGGHGPAQLPAAVAVDAQASAAAHQFDARQR